MYIDTHCHLSNEDYEDIDMIVEENRQNNINKIIISGCTLETIKESIELSSRYEDVYVTIGFHPSEAKNIKAEDLLFLEEKISNNKIVGIGEIGLDYHYGKEDKNDQIVLFEKQLELAEKHNLPVVIHTRDATSDTINILKKYRLRGVIHCFSGSVETANVYISMGFFLGIGGVVTFKNSNLYKVVESIGLEHIVLETDSPYLTPEPFRGKRNSSKYIPIIAEKISKILNTGITNVSEITTSNAINLFFKSYK